MSSLRFPSALATLTPSLWRDVRSVISEQVPTRAVCSVSLPRNAGRNGFDRLAIADVVLWSQHVGKTQAAFSAFLDRVALQVRRSISQIGQLVRDALYGQHHRPALVSLLLFACRPPTICKRVVGVIVDSVKRRAGRPGAHVLSKSSVGVPPFSTHSDASTTVVGELLGGRGVAAAKHALPHGIQWRGILERHVAR
jgi:hypothetical protein